MNPTPEQFDGISFWESVKHKVWWRDIGFNECHHYSEMCQHALKHNEKFWLQGPENIDLTEIYQQCKILALLKKDQNVTSQEC